MTSKADPGAVRVPQEPPAPSEDEVFERAWSKVYEQGATLAREQAAPLVAPAGVPVTLESRDEVVSITYAGTRFIRETQGRLPALPEPEDRDVLAERFARDPISKDATIERLQALLADVILQRNEFFARLERVEQEAGQVLSDQAGRLPALDALLVQWEADRQKHFETIDRLEKLGEGCPRAARYNGWVYGLEQCMGELKAVVAGLRADPAPRHVSEKNDTCQKHETHE